MSRKVFLIVAFLMLLSGCGQRRQPDVEHFQGDVVATLVKTVDIAAIETMQTNFPPESAVEITPEPPQESELTLTEESPAPTQEELQPVTYPGRASSPTPVLSPTSSFTPTVTPTLGVPVWEGTWKVWYQTVSGGYLAADMRILVSGTNLTGTTRFDGVDYAFQGEIYADNTQVRGDWKTASNTGSFWWRMNSAETFVGSRDNRFGFCASRGADQPGGCREIPQD